MSRGGRGGFRGGRRGPDLSWDDEESIAPSQPSNRPAPLFPVLNLKIPKPLDSSELSSVQCYLNIRERIRNGPLYSTLDQSCYADERGMVDKRAGFDPFNDQERYSTRFHKKRRTMPDLSGREYSLSYFPQELWLTLDPKRRHPIWKTLDPDVLARILSSSGATKKRKRAAAALKHNDEEVEDEIQGAAAAGQSDANDTDEDDVVTTGRRAHKAAKTRRDDPTSKRSKQKRGLEAEDDFPDAENEDDGEGEGSEEGEPLDSEFSESDDGSGDDYNAEQYFDAGDDDDFGDDGGGGGDEEPSY